MLAPRMRIMTIGLFVAIALAATAHAADVRPADALRADAAAHHARGDIAGAADLFEQAWRAYVAAGRESSPDALTTLFDLGSCQLRLGRLGRARVSYERAVNGFETAEPVDEAALSLALEGLTSALLAQESPVEARTHLQRAREIRLRVYGPRNPQTARLKALDARLAALEGRYRDALTHTFAAMTIYRGVYGNLHPRVAAMARNTVDLYLAAGEPTNARIMAMQTDYMTREIYGPDSPERVVSLRGIGRLQWQTGQFDDAAPTFRQALALLDGQADPSPLQVVDVAADLGRTLLASGRYDEARAMLRRAADAYEQVWWQAGGDEPRASFMTSPYPMLAAAEIMSVAGDGQVHDDTAAALRAWQAMLKHHGRTLQMGEMTRLLTPAQRARREELQQRRVVVAQQIERRVAAGLDQHVAALRLEHADLDEAIMQLDAELARRVRDAGDLSDDKPVRPADGAAMLGWLDVEFVPDILTSWAWVVDPAGDVHWVLLPGGWETRDASVALREEIAARGRLAGGRIDELAARLHWLRLERCLPLLGDARTLVVVPDEVTAGMPVAALRDADGRYVNERFAVVMEPRMARLAGNGEAAAGVTGAADAAGGADATPLGLLALADPPFARPHAVAMRRGDHRADPADPQQTRSVMEGALRGNRDALGLLARLPGTRTEAESIAGYYDRADLLMGEDAAEPSLRRYLREGRLSRYEVIHVATHALVDADQPSRSALVLSQMDLPDDVIAVADEREAPLDGLLTADEIAAGWRLNADLVTLSACETGLGRTAPGEGYLGFTHAFLTAGARSVVVSLWQVDDRATSLLMERFYANLRGRGMTKAAALREAQAWLRGYEVDGERVFDGVWYWGGVVVVGEG